MRRLRAEIDDLEARITSLRADYFFFFRGYIVDYNTYVDVVNGLIDEFNASIRALNALVQEYNGLLGG